jgi:hypothetical protein
VRKDFSVKFNGLLVGVLLDFLVKKYVKRPTAVRPSKAIPIFYLFSMIASFNFIVIIIILEFINKVKTKYLKIKN